MTADLARHTTVVELVATYRAACADIVRAFELLHGAEERWSLAIAECWDDDLGEWVAAAKAWLASPEVVADAERAERRRRAEQGRESVPEPPYWSVVEECSVPPVHEPEKPGTVRHTTVGGVGCVGRLRRA